MENIFDLNGAVSFCGGGGAASVGPTQTEIDPLNGNGGSDGGASGGLIGEIVEGAYDGALAAVPAAVAAGLLTTAITGTPPAGAAAGITVMTGGAIVGGIQAGFEN